MEDTQNGAARGQKTMNGKANGSLNGHLNGKPHMNGINGHAVVGPRRKQTRPQGPGFVARTFSTVARLFTWYSILTILFRCPATLEACDETSPRICKPYFQVKHAVSPHLEPYYDAYAAPYVELARPYYETLDRSVITPGWDYATRYGAPRVAQAQAFGKAQWEKSVQPQLVHYQGMAKAQYDQNLAPHVDHVTGAVVPYYEIAKTNALQTYHDVLLPSYQFVAPYALQGYDAASAFTTATAIPTALWAWDKTYLFLDGTVWPHLRVVYVENVEPQLTKIGDRLGRFSHGKSTPKPLTEALTSSIAKVASSFTKPTPSSSSTGIVSSILAAVTGTSSSTSTEEHAEITTTSSLLEPIESLAEAAGAAVRNLIPAPEVDDEEPDTDERRTARDIVAADLKDWQERYAKAADDGAAEIESQVDEIAKKAIRRNAKTTGKTLLTQLQDAASSELVTLRAEIMKIVGEVNKGESTPDAAKQAIADAVRSAAVIVKQKALAVRSWHEQFVSELNDAVTEAAQRHIQILQAIRDLALQKIGMKWAWMDGITYRDWAKYHLLKTRFDEWQGDLENLVVTNPNLAVARDEGAKIEDQAMDIAEEAAKELGRLKRVATNKLVAGDETEDFETETTQLAADAAEAARAAQPSEAEAAESIAAVVFEPEETTSAATDIVDGIPATEEPAHSETEGASADAAESIASAVFESEETTSAATDIVDHIPASTAESSPDLASTAILVETPIAVGNTTEAEEEGPAPVELPLEGEILEEPEVEESGFFDHPPEEPEEAVESATSTIKSALFGVAAESVPTRKPILDDDFFGSFSASAHSAYSAAVSKADAQYSQALSIVSKQIKGTPQPVHQQLLASVTSAYSNALETASSRMNDAIEVASKSIYGTPTTNILPTSMPVPALPSVDWERIHSIASQRLEDGRKWAEEQYESAKIAVGLATPTPSTTSEHVQKLLQNAQHNYYAGLGLAHVRYTEFLAAASSAFSSLTATSTPTPTDFAGTVSSVASVATESAASAYSAAGDSVSSVASVASDSVSSVASVAGEAAGSAASIVSENVSAAASIVAENASSVASVVGENVSAGYDAAASAAAHAGEAAAANWEAVVSDVSIRIYGAPTPTAWYDSILSQATEYAGAATSAAGDSGAVVTSAVSSYAAVASAEAAKRYEAISALVQELVKGKEPTFSESVYSRLSAAYETGASMLAEAQSTAASAAAEATEKVKEGVKYVRDEL